MAPFIQAQNLTLAFRPKNRESVTALKDFTLEVGRGEFVSIVGPSGCGKSTFLNILLGLIKPDSGEIHLNDHAHYRPSKSAPWSFKSRPTPLSNRHRQRGLGMVDRYSPAQRTERPTN